MQYSVQFQQLNEPTTTEDEGKCGGYNTAGHVTLVREYNCASGTI